MNWKRPRLSREDVARWRKAIADESDALIPIPIVYPTSEFQMTFAVILGGLVIFGGFLLNIAFVGQSVSWLAIMAIQAGIVIPLVGILAVFEVPIIYDYKVCRCCGYPYDENAKPDHCPECGADFRRIHSVGYWRSWRPRLRKYMFWTLLSWFIISLFSLWVWNWLGIL